MNWFDQSLPMVLGHRGASKEAPENTMAAFELAIEQGASGFEFDVQLSGDGVPVCIHDSSVDRTTSGQGALADLSLRELHTLDAGGGEKIPTLESVFQHFGDRILYNVEIKDDGWRDQATERKIVELIVKYRLEEKVLVSSFNPFSLRRVRPYLPTQTLSALIRGRGPFQYFYLLYSGQADHPHHKLIDAAYMVWARQRNYRVHTWTVDAADEARRLAALGVHGIVTNRPRHILEALNR